jgi:adenosine deaminase
MKANLFFREFLTSEKLLLNYFSNQHSDDESFYSTIFLGIKKKFERLPDHYIKSWISNCTDGKSGKLSFHLHLKFLCQGMATRYFETRGRDDYFVKNAVFEEWHQLAASIPPIIPVSYYLYSHSCKTDFTDRDSIFNSLQQLGRSIAGYSILPTIYDPRLSELIEREGLADLHMHLNGTTEIETIWFNAMQRPVPFSNEFKSTQHSPAIELFEQVDLQLNSKEQVLNRLKLARHLRSVIAEYLLFHFGQPIDQGKQQPKQEFEIIYPEWLSALIKDHANLPTLLEQDGFTAFANFIDAYDQQPPLLIEAMFLIAIYTVLEQQHANQNENPSFAHAVYLYLMLKTQFMQLVVQQLDQVGFDQFQKFTLTDLRSSSEQEFHSRFHQLDYSLPGDLSLLEGRFSPSKDPKWLQYSLHRILADFDRFQADKARETTSDFSEEHQQAGQISYKTLEQLLTEPKYPHRLQLSLIAHFIKEADNRLNKPADHCSGWVCRHHELRNKLDKTANNILQLRQKYKALDNVLHGFDAAANELHASPEVFAPIFRKLRQQAGYANFTFHAGEDFVHLLSGIRYVYEAIEFTELNNGNRIGHGTAIGIDPALWRERIGPTIYTKQGERLDDLVLAHRLLLEAGQHTNVLPRLESEIRRLSYQVYQENCTPEVLYEAWLLRSLNPLLLFEQNDPLNYYIRPDAIKELDEMANKFRQYPQAFLLFAKYHGREYQRLTDITAETGSFTSKGPSYELSDKNYRFIVEKSFVTNYEKIIEIDVELANSPAEAVLTKDVFRCLQKQVLKLVRARNLAIESLPTSNVRISFYNKLSEHHIFNWLGVGDEPDMEVPVVLGSDDPGIFATTLRNEYAHLLQELDKRVSKTESIDILSRIIRNGKVWNFAAQR